MRFLHSDSDLGMGGLSQVVTPETMRGNLIRGQELRRLKVMFPEEIKKLADENIEFFPTANWLVRGGIVVNPELVRAREIQHEEFVRAVAAGRVRAPLPGERFPVFSGLGQAETELTSATAEEFLVAMKGAKAEADIVDILGTLQLPISILHAAEILANNSTKVQNLIIDELMKKGFTKSQAIQQAEKTIMFVDEIRNQVSNIAPDFRNPQWGVILTELGRRLSLVGNEATVEFYDSIAKLWRFETVPSSTTETVQRLRFDFSNTKTFVQMISWLIAIAETANQSGFTTFSQDAIEGLKNTLDKFGAPEESREPTIPLVDGATRQEAPDITLSGLRLGSLGSPARGAFAAAFAKAGPVAKSLLVSLWSKIPGASAIGTFIKTVWFDRVLRFFFVVTIIIQLAEGLRKAFVDPFIQRPDRMLPPGISPSVAAQLPPEVLRFLEEAEKKLKGEQKGGLFGLGTFELLFLGVAIIAVGPQLIKLGQTIITAIIPKKKAPRGRPKKEIEEEAGPEEIGWY